jgi:hypothetical protein
MVNGDGVFHKFYDAVYGQDAGPFESSGWIQWKGTNVCVDLHCHCGASFHFDGEFFYHWRCTCCGAVYAVGQNIKLIPLTPEQITYVESTGTTIHTSDEFEGGTPVND